MLDEILFQVCRWPPHHQIAMDVERRYPTQLHKNSRATELDSFENTSFPQRNQRLKRTASIRSKDTKHLQDWIVQSENVWTLGQPLNPVLSQATSQSLQSITMCRHASKCHFQVLLYSAQPGTKPITELRHFKKPPELKRLLNVRRPCAHTCHKVMFEIHAVPGNLPLFSKEQFTVYICSVGRRRRWRNCYRRSATRSIWKIWPKKVRTHTRTRVENTRQPNHG